MCSSSARCIAPGTLFVARGVSSNSAFLDAFGVCVSVEVRLSTIEFIDCGLEGFLLFPSVGPLDAALNVSRKGLPSRGDSGEKDGNEVNDLSEAAMEDVELDGCEVSLALCRDLVRIVCLPLLAEALDSCDVERSRGVTEDEREDVDSMSAIWHDCSVTWLSLDTPPLVVSHNSILCYHMMQSGLLRGREGWGTAGEILF